MSNLYSGWSAHVDLGKSPSSVSAAASRPLSCPGNALRWLTDGRLGRQPQSLATARGAGLGSNISETEPLEIIS
jgi:hypothetical protein